MLFAGDLLCNAGTPLLLTADEDLVGVRILILTTFELDTYVVHALRVGASGFLGKGAEPAQLPVAIRTAAAGEALRSAHATRALIGRHLDTSAAATPSATPDLLAALTAREREVVARVRRRGRPGRRRQLPVPMVIPLEFEVAVRRWRRWSGFAG